MYLKWLYNVHDKLITVLGHLLWNKLSIFKKEIKDMFLLFCAFLQNITNLNNALSA